MDVDGISVAAALAIKNGSVVSGYIAGGTGHLILVQYGGTEIDAGAVTPANTIVGGTVDVPTQNLVFTKFDGSTSVGGRVLFTPTTVTFAASGSFTKASYPGMTRALFEIWGAGGGGGGGRTNAPGGGGGGGGYNSILLPVAKIPTSMPLTVGAAGAATGAGLAGGIGGSSSIDVFADGTRLIGSGGGGGGHSNASTNNAYPGGRGGYDAVTGASILGASASATASGTDAANGSTIYGGGTGSFGVPAVGASGPGIPSVLGGNGGGRAPSPQSGFAPGGGGAGGAIAGASAGQGSAPGGRGEVRVTVYYD